MATLRAVGTTARVAIGVALAIALAGCAGGGGFRPMYASLDGGPALEAKLASVDVSTIPGRVGQRIRNQLIFQNTGGGARAAPLYRLDVTFTESIQATLVKTTGEAASSIYVIDARFQLTDIAAKKVVLSGGSYARSPFDRFPSIYANVRAREDAEVRAANTIAEDIRSRLATFLSREKI
jgi:LPS-assembly lipoprotein